MSRDGDSLVYSTDGAHRARCPRCGRDPCVCAPAAEIIPGQTVLRLHLDKKGRGGKSVTVVSDLPPNAEYFGALLKKLKAHCGTGGTLKEGALEIQGDQRDKVQAFLERQGFTIRRSGG